jgi:tetratricopeptide (TPR) repeat protein
MKKNLKTITKTNEWKEAEFMYSDIIAQTMFPLFESLTQEDIDDAIKQILKKCPEFFPALLYQGEGFITQGEDSKGIALINQGIDYMYEIAKPAKFKEEFEKILDVLENNMRYDVALEVLYKMLKKFPDNSFYYDNCANNIIKQPNLEQKDIDKAFELQNKAIELEPKNATYYSNMAWMYIVIGDLKNAEDFLNKGFNIDKNNNDIMTNFKLLKLMKKYKSKNLYNFFIRPIDWELVNYLEEEEEGEDEIFGDIYGLCKNYNSLRIEAFKIYHLKMKKFKPHKILSLINMFRIFMQFLDKVACEVVFLYDNIDLINDYYEVIMHKLIFKFGDINEKIFKDIIQSLTEFYRFLKVKKLITNTEYKELTQNFKDYNDKLLNKMKKYNKIRHNDNVSEKEKEKIREELFDGDHSWPHL